MSASQPDTGRHAVHEERLRAPWTWWLLLAGFSVSVWWSFLLVTPLIVSTVAGLLSAGALSAMLWRYGDARVAVVDTGDGHELVAGRAHVPVRLLGRPQALDATALRHRLGPGADARSYVMVRPWSRTGVLLPVADPLDPTPSWVVGSRRPQALADAVRAAQSPLAH